MKEEQEEQRRIRRRGRGRGTRTMRKGRLGRRRGKEETGTSPRWMDLPEKKKNVTNKSGETDRGGGSGRAL